VKRLLAIFAAACCALFLLASCTKPVPAAGGFNWPQWRGLAGNGQSRETEWDPAAIASPRVLWNADAGSGYSDVVLQAGRLYTAGMKQGTVRVYCFDAQDGRKVWERAVVSAMYPQATLAVDRDMVFMLTSEGVLHGMDSRTGRVRWRKDLVADYGALKPHYGFAGSPIVEGDLVVLTVNSAGMAVRRDTGALAWTSEKPPAEFASVDRGETNGAGYSTPVLFDGPTGRQALLTGWSGLTAVDVGTGTPAWHFAWDIEPGGCSEDPIVFGDKVCMPQAFLLPASRSGLLLRVGESGPGILWRTSELYGWFGYPMIIGDSLYALYGGPNYTNSGTASLRCLDLDTGRLQWDEPFGNNRQNKSLSLAAANGILIVLDDKGTLYTATASHESYKEIARCDVLQGAKKPRLFWVPPVLCNAKIYCRNFSGDVVCIDVSRK
jgi:outer membrane protein assembly factor BamB